ncbi:S-DNA-T family DNA segregation ATPase FtsK/SpoIIIE [Diaminobutyricimonas aerilata]|uniref:S-DNA-T family DNA segregation ATPase FtsK/SpoIIIE n=1 Tax=Diaminobutyricimonas aerilata TaxID=1162967 RepID=A0A2M9CLC9_9MICO|nr:FtsK/SpoIIIE domain-containing protein [Diaminobutyricimonas aerilata]PJJ72703.1 S-DNA-T family DNA segregation ATPase FtsK/SpoIIIE [Diaminobutyricimonas aerilata]
MSAPPVDDLRFVLPDPATPHQPAPFPVLATLAPVAAAVVLWAITRSPFALAFALLGPLIAVASTVDGRVHRRRHARREEQRIRRECEERTGALAALHALERAALDLAVAGPAAVVAMAANDPERWRHPASSPVPVMLGRGDSPSRVRVSPEAPAREHESIAALRRRARTLTDAPVAVDARLGIGVVGPEVVARAYVRGVLAQLASRLPPSGTAVVGDTEEEFLRLPHRHRTGRDPARVDLVGDEGSVCVAWAEDAAGLPRDCRVVVRVGDGSPRLQRHPDGRVDVRLDVPYLTRSEAQEFASTLARAAEHLGAVPAPPAAVPFSTLTNSPSGGRGLDASIGHDGEGEFALDLAVDGPHAVVAGTTGSGKSELLIAWVLAMAARHAPDRVTFLLVDFKGGAAFAPLESLPHVVGVLTDLDDGEARRALESLGAELRRRERLLAEVGARSIEQVAGLARLVVLVDEYAVLAEQFPDLHSLVADLAARGRSLGVHLVLCTQRPAGVVRDAVLANAGLRVSLRVTSAADSTAVLGVPHAAELAATPAGRALVVRRGEPAVPVQVALAGAADIAGVAALHPTVAVHRPWLPPLPSAIPRSTLGDHDGIVVGVLDVPSEQRQEVLTWTEGHLVAVGSARSGRSTLLAALHAEARVPVIRPAARLAQVWDALDDAEEAFAGAVPALLLLDDLDAVLHAAGDEYATVMLDRLVRLLREGPAGGVRAAMTVARASGRLAHVLAACRTRLLLRIDDRQEHLMAGGSADNWGPRLPPGGAHLDGRRLQVALPHRLPAADEHVRAVRVHPGREGLVVVSARPRELIARWRDAGPALRIADVAAHDRPQLEVGSGAAPTVLVGDPDVWQGHWNAVTELGRRLPVLFDGCTVAELRTLTRRRELPPPLPPDVAGWLLEPDGRLRRAAIETGSPPTSGGAPRRRRAAP